MSLLAPATAPPTPPLSLLQTPGRASLSRAPSSFWPCRRKAAYISRSKSDHLLSCSGTASANRVPHVAAQNRQGNNINEDTDEMFNALFDKYGKVVYSRNDKRPPSAEADDDAESLSFAVTLAKVANDVKAADIRVLFVKPLVYWTRFFIIVTAFSRPQIDAIGSRMRDTAEKQFSKVPTGDSKPNSWTLLDFGDVVVHIFLPEQRAFYDLEEFYGNATPIELPFDNHPTFRN